MRRLVCCDLEVFGGDRRLCRRNEGRVENGSEMQRRLVLCDAPPVSQMLQAGVLCFFAFDPPLLPLIPQEESRGALPPRGTWEKSRNIAISSRCCAALSTPQSYAPHL